MNRLCRKIVICAFIFYLGSTGFTRYDEYRSCDELTRIFHALPMDAFPLKYLDGTNMIKTQIGVLPSSDVIQLLETNPTKFPHMQDGLSLTHIDVPPSERDYLVIRFQNESETSYFDIKYYFSCFFLLY